MKLTKIIVCGFLVFALSGCKDRRHEITFYKNITVPVNEEVETCSFVESVDGIKVTEDMIDKVNHQINVEGTMVSCGTINPNKLEAKLIIYSVDGKTFDLSVKVVDEDAPVIAVKDNIEVQVDNEYFDIKNVLNISDNYDKNCNIEIQGDFDIHTIGEYAMKVKASDASGNETTKEFKITVTEKEVVEVITTSPSSPGSNGSQSNLSPSSPGGTGSSGSSDSENPAEPFISGVKDITVAKNSSLSDLVFTLSSGITASSNVTIDYTLVNLSDSGSYTVFYYGQDGAKASCIVTVQ